ncbi:YdcF family protein [Synechococcus sp. BA-132 BA5]|uniref:YdcF family protein n=1 Tax=Synechococcus sp. BA-132 BA5 TaxID=3110252 RepID=UPI002B1E99E9|nr:YdcF family protein [Synechococcus sp. BA-132 BA5]MEA5413983.1 YdcF family protein [Synechococcus sp. BA-132 BA5]
MQWQTCPTAPLAWFELRDVLLSLLRTPALLVPLLGLLAAVLAWRLQLPRRALLAMALLAPLAFAAIYTPLATALLTSWLHTQLPSSPAPTTALPVLVIVGRDPPIAAATTQAAATRLRQGKAVAVYVSGDARSTAERLVQLGVAPTRIAGDSCARTTWENATLTAAWLRQHHPGAPVLLITDPWQLPRASHAFARQGLQVQPLALRETVATVLYRLQGRL